MPSARTPIDSDNTSRLAFTRGPNSILFGVGNPGGGRYVEQRLLPDALGVSLTSKLSF